MIKKRCIPMMCLALVVGMLLSGCSPTASTSAGQGKEAGEAGKVKITMAQGGDGLIWLASYVAHEKKLFEAEGLEVETVKIDGGSKATQAVIAGEAVAQAQSTIHSLKAVSEGNDLISVAVLNKEFPVFSAISNEAAQKAGITKDMAVEEQIKRLKGLKIGISSPGSSTDLLIRFLLKKVGLNPDKDVTLTPFGKGDALLAALEKGAIDVFLYPSPYAEMAEAKGKGMVIINPNKVKELQGFAYLTLQVNKKFIEENPETVKKLVRAYAKASAFIHEDEKGTKEIIKKQFPALDEKVIDLSYQNNIAAYPKDTEEMFMTPQQFSQNLDWLNMTEKKPVQLNKEQVVNQSFIEKTAK